MRYLLALITLIVFVGCSTVEPVPEPYVFQIRIIKLDGSTVSVVIPGSMISLDSAAPGDPGVVSVLNAKNQFVYVLDISGEVPGVFITRLSRDGRRDHVYFKAAPYTSTSGVRVGLVHDGPLQDWISTNKGEK